MSDIKQVKVDNWGVYFLQRLKHFFNRTDYCDLTLQFQDNAQLKVHRLVLSACTEYFEVLERTCEMYEDCLVMPDDLQADVVVPIVNFMYTGQLEFKPDLLERLHQTSQIMNMPVLTKLLDAQLTQLIKQKPTVSYSGKSYKKHDRHQTFATSSPSTSSTKRSYTKAFENMWVPSNKPDAVRIEKSPDANLYQAQSTANTSKKMRWTDPCPTRYELPEDLDTDNVFGEPFRNISYESKPLMVHPDARKQYSSKSNNILSNASSSKIYSQGISTLDIVECKKIVKEENIYDDGISEFITDDNSLFGSLGMRESRKDSSQLFDKILDRNDKPKVTIENKEKSNVDHAKIISEVLKKYPHLVKSNKNIKLKIVNAPSTKPVKKHQQPTIKHQTPTKVKNTSDFTFETDVLNSTEAAKLIAMGAENVSGPWICLICGTPGRALNFTSYYKFRRHLVNVHNEKPVSNICEYCGLKSHKRNYLLHHMYTKHGIDPPPQYHFPKCNSCSYVALTEGFLIKHKLSHTEGGVFRCNVCSSIFKSTSLLLQHIQQTGHKYSAERKSNLQCIYCLKVFLRETNLYTHLKTHHKYEAKADGVIDDSDEEDKIKHKKIKRETIVTKSENYDIPSNLEIEYEDDDQYQIQERPDGNIEIITKNARTVTTTPKQKILNDGFNPLAPKTKKPNILSGHSDIYDDSLSSPNNIITTNEEIVMIDEEEYIMRNNELIPRKKLTKEDEEEFIISEMIPPNSQSITAPSTSLEYTNIDYEESVKYNKSPQKKTVSVNQPIQFVVSNDNEFKAFMPSNHPILFENSGTNKTLTVLTAAPTTLDNTTIDLNSAQSNDMMIIQDDYPLTVTESVPTVNSNIVVVYSHPVDESKPYTLLSSQDIGTQYTSAVITQNYSTTTSSTPVMRAQILGPEVNSWQTNSEEKDKTNIVEAEQVLTVVEQTNVIDSENIHNELPEVQIVGLKDENVSIQQTIHGENEITSDPVHDQNLEENIDTDSKDMSETKEDNETQSPPEDKTNEQCIVEVNPDNNSTLNAELEPDCNIVIVQTPDTEILSPNASDLKPTNSEEPKSDNEATNEQETLGKDESRSTSEIESVNADTIKLGSKEVIKSITSLTLEWSEDEDEICGDKEDSNEDHAGAQSEEIEESIENIEHELNKDQELNGDNDIQHDEVPTQNENPEIQNTTASTIPQEKISSLLNDWEENDSQEGQELQYSPDENNKSSTREISDENETNNKNEVVTSSGDMKKEGDPLKTLVSDWDEEEEDKE